MVYCRKGCRPATVLKRDFDTGCFGEFYEVSQNTFSAKHLWATVSELTIIMFINNVFAIDNKLTRTTSGLKLVIFLTTQFPLISPLTQLSFLNKI